MTDRINEPSAIKSRITDWPLEDRPREKLMRDGPANISNAELIAILLGHGTSKYNAVELARKLLREFGSLENLSESSLKELQKVPGIGPAKAVTLLAAFQLYRSLQRQQAENGISSFRNPAEVARIYQPVIGHLEQESFYVILLNSVMQRISDHEISRGIIDSSPVHPREVFNPAIRNMAKGIIVMHNHPSGACQPSDNDREITKRLIKAGEILDIKVYDHIIITTDQYFSFKENALM